MKYDLWLMTVEILSFLFSRISDSDLTQTVSSWLNYDSNDHQHDLTLTWLKSLILWLTQLDSFESEWVRVESNLTHDSWFKHNPAKDFTLWRPMQWSPCDHTAQLWSVVFKTDLCSDSGLPPFCQVALAALAGCQKRSERWRVEMLDL